MTDRIDFGSEPWQAIPRRVLRDASLSARAKGGLVTLLSHEEGWVRSSIAVLCKENNIGKKQAQAIMAELREHGYAELITERVENTIRRRYIISAVPKGAGSQPDLMASLSSTFPDRHVSGPTRNGANEEEALDVDPLEVDPLVTSKSPSGLFKEVTPDQMYLASRIEDSKGKTLTPKALQKLNTEFGTAEVTSALRRLHGFPPPDPIGSVYAYVESLCTLSKESA